MSKRTATTLGVLGPRVSRPVWFLFFLMGMLSSPVIAANTTSETPETTPKIRAGTAPQASGACKPGFVWREANAQDHVCVTPQTRGQVLQDNKAAPSRVATPGSDACKQGYVWREANAQDHVCVTTQTRAQMLQDNALVSSRLAPTTVTAPAPLTSSRTTIETPSKTTGLRSLPALPMPVGLTSTTDPPTCTQHGGLGGGLACDALLAQGQLALIWSFEPNVVVTGFHVYQVTGGAHSLVATQANGTGVTVALLAPPPSGVFAANCYAVAAYDASGDGTLSRQFCPTQQSVFCSIQAPPTGQTVNICASKVTTWHGAGNPGALNVGYDGTDSQFGSMIFLVDNTTAHGRQLQSAHLNMTVQRSIVGPSRSNTSVDTSTSCLAYIFEATNVWWSSPGAGPPVPASSAVSQSIGAGSPDPVDVQGTGPNMSFDVTPIVTDWMGNVFDFGFVLYGSQAPFGRNQSGNAVCQTSYQVNSIVLQIQFY